MNENEGTFASASKVSENTEIYDPASRARCGCCWYRLEGLGREGVCPECGLPFDLDVPETYVTKRPFLCWPLWLPMLIFSTLCGLLVVIPFLLNGYSTTGLWFGVPIALGSIVGYTGRGGLALKVCLGLAIAASVVLAMFSMNIAGLFCGLILAGIFIVPIVLGIGVGAALGALAQARAKEKRFRRASKLRSLGFLLIPVIWMVIEGPAAGHGRVETIVTTERVMVAPAEVWDSLMFYEEVEREPPLLLRFGLPVPVRTHGEMMLVGDVKVCEYRKGELKKRITEIRPNELLAFSVVHQRIGFEKSVRLIDGSFALREVAPDETELTLTTRYEPLLTPRWVWRPIEKLSAQTLHRHVVGGIADEGEELARTRAAIAGAP